MKAWNKLYDHTIGDFSGKLSSVWAKRLDAVNHTQGVLEVKARTFSFAEDIRSSKVSSPRDKMKIKPKWPDFLVDTSFDVVKVNKFGQKYRRTIKLTQNNVITIKNGNNISY